MAWRFRRRITLFPGVRINLSKSGISTTFGVPGASINVGKEGAYLNTGIPGTGFYNRQKIWDLSESNKNQNESATSPIYYLPDNLREIKSKDNDTITSEGLKGIKETLIAAFQERRKLQDDITEGEEALASAEKSLMYFSIIPFHKILFNKGYEKRFNEVSECNKSLEEARKQLKDCNVSIDIGIEPSKIHYYDKLKLSFEQLSKSIKKWDIYAQQSVDRVRERSAAGINNQREPITLSFSKINFIRCDYDAFKLSNVNGGDLYFYPAFLVVLGEKNSFALIDYNDIVIEFEFTDSLEHEGVPSDTKVIGSTWRYVNKNGSRDLRFSDNFQIPIVHYGEITFKSNTGLLEKYLFSNCESAHVFVNDFMSFIQSTHALQNQQNNDSSSSNRKPAIKLSMSRLKAFELLGISDKAKPEEIQDKYHEMMKKYHPDKVAHLGEEFKIIAEQKSKEINEAYNIITS